MLRRHRALRTFDGYQKVLEDSFSQRTHVPNIFLLYSTTRDFLQKILAVHICSLTDWQCIALQFVYLCHSWSVLNVVLNWPTNMFDNSLFSNFKIFIIKARSALYFYTTLIFPYWWKNITEWQIITCSTKITWGTTNVYSFSTTKCENFYPRLPL